MERNPLGTDTDSNVEGRRELDGVRAAVCGTEASL
jgi:hypothetical protein